MNHKGQILSEATTLFWRLCLIALVVMAIFFTMIPVFASKQDIRQAEAVLLSKKVVDCLSKNAVADLNSNLDSCIADGDYYINASLASFDSSLKKELVKGDSLELYCSLIEKGSTQIKQMPPSCIRQRYYILIDNNGKIEKGSLDILIGVRKAEENIK